MDRRLEKRWYDDRNHQRVMVLTFVLVDQYTAITIVFAAKSIARFNELEDRNMAEYYLIGTLLSITFALIIGIVTRLDRGRMIDGRRRNCYTIHPHQHPKRVRASNRESTFIYQHE